MTILRQDTFSYNFLRYVHRKIYVFINNSFVVPSRAKYFKQNSLNVLKKLQSDLTELNVEFFFCFGTLLGMVRDGELILRDGDLDLVIHEEDQVKVNNIAQHLIQKGYKHKFRTYVDELGITSDTFYFTKVRMDIHYLFRKEKDFIYLPLESKTVRTTILPLNRIDYYMSYLELPKCKKIVLRKFKDMYVNIPNNFEDILEALYGKTWKIPDPNFHYGNSFYSCQKKLDMEGFSEKI